MGFYCFFLTVFDFPPPYLNWNGLWILYTKQIFMLPMWFFIVLIFVICCLLYVTRTTEDNLMMMSKNHLRKLQFWIKGSIDKQ